MRKTNLVLAGAAILALAFSISTTGAPPKGKPVKTKESKEAVVFPMEAKAVDRSNKEKLNSYADTLARVMPAVVSIHTAQTVRVMSNRLWHYELQEKKVPTGLGSGTIIHQDGYILTNRHVISDNEGKPAEEITVELSDKRQFTAKVIGSDPKTDVAIIKIDGKNLPVAKVVDSVALRVGDIVFAVGNPLGVGMSVSQGIVSALGRDVGILSREGGLENFIQTDASINPGNSGGPLVDTEGRVVGMNTFIVSPTRGSIGIGFAVPSNLAVGIVASLVNHGSVARGYIGVAAQDITPQLAENLGLPEPRGALVSEVVEDSPADKGGLKPEDTVVAINGQRVENWSALRYIVSQLKPESKARVEIYRDGKKKTLEIVVGGAKQGELEVQRLFGNVKFQKLTKALRERYEIPSGLKVGVVVTEVAPDSVFQRQVPVGAVILTVNGKVVSTPEELYDFVDANRVNRLLVWANGRRWVVTVHPRRGNE
ncbi:MAG: trypsin-like peptidase domain-containing protein [Puniceicoccales bacterium]|jgi:serine protease Do/serine protease DegQ|nr:trypsin-like peptidase domain-containing protein [Puniceicoccales bacterium]